MSAHEIMLTVNGEEVRESVDSRTSSPLILSVI